MTFASIKKTHSVTLNLFQGPSGGKFGESRIGAKPAGLLVIPCSGYGDKWTLKQVQGDGRGGPGA